MQAADNRVAKQVSVKIKNNCKELLIILNVEEQDNVRSMFINIVRRQQRHVSNPGLRDH